MVYKSKQERHPVIRKASTISVHNLFSSQMLNQTNPEVRVHTLCNQTKPSPQLGQIVFFLSPPQKIPNRKLKT